MDPALTPLEGRHWRTGETVRVLLRGGVIESVSPAAPQTAPPPDRWLAPALVDLQINGYAGVDLQSDDVDEAGLQTLARGLRRDGCGRFLATLITAPWPVILRRIQRMKTARDRHAGLRESLAGWHIEGPFLSECDGYRGAHKKEWIADPRPEHFRALKEITGDDPVLITLAPERPGAIESVREAARLGFRVSLGHTNAGAEDLRQAAAAGATGFTHLGNACPQQLDRHDNVVLRVLDMNEWVVGVIPDGIHIPPPLFRILRRLTPPGKLYLTTDAMSAGGMPPGTYSLGGEAVEVGADQVVRPPGKTHFAGSALSPAEGVRRAARMLGVDWREVWPLFSTVPASWMGLPTGLEPGAAGGVCVVRERPGGKGPDISPVNG